MSNLELPDISKLDSKQPDYVQKLDEGLISILKMYESVSDSFADIFLTPEEFVDRMKNKGIEVLDVKENYSLNEKVGGKNTTSFSAHEISMKPNSNNFAIIEDLFDELEETYSKRIKETKKDLNKILDVGNKYAHAIDDLTTLTSLTPENAVYDSGHFYFIVRGDVYETHIQWDLKDKNNFEPQKSEKLTPEMFKDQNVLASFKGSTDVKAMAYLVENPSQVIELNGLSHLAYVLACQGLAKLENEKFDADLAAKKEAEDLKTPFQKIMDSIKLGIRGLDHLTQQYKNRQ